jgi:hypothetical protein
MRIITYECGKFDYMRSAKRTVVAHCTFKSYRRLYFAYVYLYKQLGLCHSAYVLVQMFSSAVIPRFSHPRLVSSNSIL